MNFDQMMKPALIEWVESDIQHFESWNDFLSLFVYYCYQNHKLQDKESR